MRILLNPLVMWPLAVLVGLVFTLASLFGVVTGRGEGSLGLLIIFILFDVIAVVGLCLAVGAHSGVTP